MKILNHLSKAVMAFTLSAVGAFAATVWDGTADVSWFAGDAQAYNLTTAEQLAGLAELVNNGTSSFEGKTITLGADIFLNDTTGSSGGTWASVPRTAWTPIGTSKYPFKGEFDGLAGANKKRKIYGLYFNDSTASYVGLFGYTDGVKISNLDMLIGRVIAQNDVGALVGRSIAGTITNVHAEVKVKGANHVGGLVGYTSGSLARVSVTENVVGQDSVGGVAGYVGGDITGTAKSNCYFTGSVDGRDWVGGLAGRMAGTMKYAYHNGGNLNGNSIVGGLAGEIGGSVLNSYSEGSVTAVDRLAGGLVGYVTGAVDSSYHVNGDVSGGKYIGGLVGYVYGNVTNSYSEGDVTGTGSDIGGLVGFLYDNSSSKIVKCYAKGSVKGSSTSWSVGGLAGTSRSIDSSYHVSGAVSGKTHVGGLVGSAYGSVTHSYSEGDVSGAGNNVGGVAGYAESDIGNSYHVNGNVVGVDSVGGVVGYIRSTINTAYHVGGDVSGQNYVGGVAGQLYYPGHSVTFDLLNNSRAESDVSGKNYVGGLVGQLTLYRDNYSRDTYVGKILDSESKGNVEGSNYVGGIVGNANKTWYYYSDNMDVVIQNSNHVKGAVIGSGDNIGGVAGYTAGSIWSSSHKNGSVSGTKYVGGLVGQGTFVNDSYADCYVKGTGSFTGGVAGYLTNDVIRSYHLGNVDGEGYVGGLAGSAILIRDTYAEGNVTGTANYIGGLIGEQRNGDFRIVRSYVKGAVSAEKSSYVGGVVGQAYGRIDSTTFHIGGDITGKDYVGGVVGYARNPVDSAYHKGGDVFGNSYVGGVVGNTESTVKNSYAEGDVKGTSFRIGGLAGRTNGVVENSYHIDGVVEGVTFDVGGLIGRTETSVTNSYAKGVVSGEGCTIGGLVGYAYSGTISDSYHTDGAVSATSFGVGGLVGYTEGSVVNSYHKLGAVVGTDSVGGVVGVIRGSVRASYSENTVVSGRNTVGGLAGYAASSIDDSRSLADSVTGIFQVGGLVGNAKGVVDSSFATSHVKGDDNVGGLIGSAYASVSNSYALGNVVGDVDHSSAGNDNVGGLVGYAYAGSITKSMALGNIRGTTKVGGLVGRFEGTGITDSYAGGSVTGLYDGDPADEIGNYYIGGLVGYGKGSLSRVYASGAVKGMEVDPFMTGCLVGSVSSTMSISDSYYDETICKLGTEGFDPEVEETLAEISGTPGQTTAAMQTKATFENWDFENTWKIMEDTYPFLQIYSNSLTNAVVVTGSLEGIEYDGIAKTPIVTSVTLFGETLTWETEYTIAYENNVNAGTALIKICGMSPYGGCKVVPFEIAPVAIKPTIADIEDAVYTGREIKPTLTVMNGDVELNASEFVVEFENNVNVGTATATVTIKGNYSGSATKTFKITKATPVIAGNPKASDIGLGAALSNSKLEGGSANVEGEFAWVAPDTIPTLDNEGYEVVFVPADTVNYNKSAAIVVAVKVIDKAHVVVNVGAESVLDVFVEKGSKFALPAAPDSVGYDFAGWYNGKTLAGAPGDSLVASASVTIEAKFTAKKFTITFVDFDETELQSGDVDYGTVPTFAGKTPTRVATAQYSYTFKGWDAEIVAVTEAATYKAVYDSVVNKYVVTFLGVDDEELQSESLEYGATPEYAGETPTKAATAQYTYKFAGWSPEIAEVTEAATYVAAFDSVVNKYLVTFNDEDGTALQSDSVAYGEVPEYAGKTPTKESTAERNYTFVGWTPKVVAVTGDAAYTAVYDSTGVTYTIAFVNYDGTELQSDELLYGATPEYAGETPTRKATAQFTYTFAGWNAEIVAVTEAATYKAVYDSVVNKYTITFADENGETISSSSVAYGEKPAAPAKDPVKAATAQYTYTFAGWSPAIAAVTGKATYIAVFDSVLNAYKVTFLDFDGSELKSQNVEYGKAATAPADPKREGYDFVGWDKEFDIIVADLEVTAQYEKIVVPPSSSSSSVKPNSSSSDKPVSSSSSVKPESSSSDKPASSSSSVKPNSSSSDKPASSSSSVKPNSSSSDKPSSSSSSVKPESSSSDKPANSSSSVKPESSSSDKPDALVVENVIPQFNAEVVGRSLQISGARIGSRYAIMDMQGRIMNVGRVNAANFNVALPQSGSYMVRVGNQTQRVNVK